MSESLTKSPERCTSLEEVRAGIDDVDRQIVSLLGRRFAYVRAAAAFKKEEQNVRAPDRVAAVLASRRAWGMDAGVSGDLVASLFETIVSHGIASELAHWRAHEAAK